MQDTRTFIARIAAGVAAVTMTVALLATSYAVPQATVMAGVLA